MNLKKSHQREVILEELRKVTSHPTADEIYMIVRKIIPNISLGTVYRNLELLFDLGKIDKLEFANNQKRFDGNIIKHEHLICEKCNSIGDIIPKGIKNLHSYLNEFILENRLKSYKLILTGLCEECNKEELKCLD